LRLIDINKDKVLILFNLIQMDNNYGLIMEKNFRNILSAFKKLQKKENQKYRVREILSIPLSKLINFIK